MDALEKWMIIQFTPHQTNTLPKWIFFNKTFLKIILAAKWIERHSSPSPTSSDDLCIPFCIYPYSLVHTLCKLTVG